MVSLLNLEFVVDDSKIVLASDTQNQVEDQEDMNDIVNELVAGGYRPVTITKERVIKQRLTDGRTLVISLEGGS